MENQIIWEKDTLKEFTQKDYLANHNIHNNQIFSDEGLIDLINSYPEESLEVFTMGHNPCDPSEWALGRRNNLDGRQLLDAVKNGRVWLNLRKTNSAVPATQKICDALFGEIKEKTGVGTMKHDIGLLISSPNAQVYYHADMPLVMLVQLRGIKKVYLYPPKSPYIKDSELEALALRAKDENLSFDADFDKDAFVHDLKPGEFLTWKQNAPHRIVNHDCVNVSLSIEFMTTKAAWRANVLYANGCLRRFFGLNPSIEKSNKIIEIFKVVYARIIKAMGGYRGPNKLPVPKFTLDNKELGKINFDDGINPPIPQKKAA